MTNVMSFLFLFLTAGIINAQDKKSSDLIQFCNTKHEIFLDSLDKCTQLVSSDPHLKIMSYHIRFEVGNKQEKDFNVLGDALTPEIVKLFREYHKSINNVYIDITAEKDSRFIKLPPLHLMFFW